MKVSSDGIIKFVLITHLKLLIIKKIKDAIHEGFSLSMVFNGSELYKSSKWLI